jgi:mevalonate kinase
MTGPRTAEAPGKVILLGEHAVVFGETALAAALPFGVRATVTPMTEGGLRLDAPGVPVDDARVRQAVELLADASGVAHAHIRVESDLPVGGGLGSSAAFSVALVRALATGPVDDERLLRLSLASEALFHGTPSGVDSAACARGGLLRFRRTAEGFDLASIEAARPFTLVVAETGRTRRTSSSVASLRTRVEAEPSRWKPIVARLGSLAEGGISDVEAGRLESLGARMNEAQSLLDECGVSSPELDAIVTAARGAGALGAKLTGAGGGGAALALVVDPVPVVEAIEAKGFRTRVVQLG